jgi:hypothetical protein
MMRAHSIHRFLKSLAIVIPIFYNVKPSDLRWRNKDGQYAWLKKDKAQISDRFSNKKWEIEAPRDCLQVVSWNCRGYPWIRDSGLGPITKGKENKKKYEKSIHSKKQEYVNARRKELISPGKHNPKGF